MIIGSGDIASVLTDRVDLTFFASGVSNSLCEDEKEFEREEDLFRETRGEHLVYFSTLSVYEKDSPYTNHKRNMEEQVKKWFDIYTIIRLGNITWGKNPNTIINFFKNKIKNNEEVKLRDEYKHICSLKEFNYWIDNIPKFSTEMNITGERLHVQQLYNLIKEGRI